MVVATVIGGAGRMGGWFASFLKENGYQIIICDRNRKVARRLARKNRFTFLENATVAVQRAQVAVLATPTAATATLLREIEPYLSPRSLLVEISSIKNPVKAQLREMRRRGIAVLSIHPMFGPGIETLREKAIVTAMFPRGNAAARRFLALFRKRGARIIQSDISEHDKLASIVLTMPHFMNITMVNALKTCGIEPNRLRAIAGTTFKLQLLIAEALYEENYGNEASLMMDSKQSVKVLNTFLRCGTRTFATIRRKARGSLLQDLKKGRDYLAGDQMYGDVYDLFNAAVEASTFH